MAADLTIFKAALAALRGNGTRFSMVEVASSLGVSEAAGDTSGSNYNDNAAANSVVMAMAGRLAELGYPMNANGWMGDGGCGQYGDAYFGTFQKQLTYAGQWFDMGPYDPDTAQGANGGRGSIGGSPLLDQKQQPSGTDDGSYCAFTPSGVMPAGGVTDRFVVFAQRTQVATLSTSADGIFSNLAVTPADEALVRLERAAPGRAVRSYYLNQTPSNNGTYIAIQGMMAYDSQTPAIDVFNLAMRGSSVKHWIRNDGPHSYTAGLALLAPKLIVLELYINDMLGGVPLSTARATADIFAARWKASATIIVRFPSAIKSDGQGGRPSQAIFDAFKADAVDYAASNNFLFIDGSALSGAYDPARWRDEVHNSKSISALVGRGSADALHAAATNTGTTTGTGTGTGGGGTGGSSTLGAAVAPDDRTITFLRVPPDTARGLRTNASILWAEPLSPGDHLDYAAEFANLIGVGVQITQVVSITLTAQAVALGVDIDESTGRGIVIDSVASTKVGAWFLVDDAYQGSTSFNGAGLVVGVTYEVRDSSNPARTYQRTGALIVRFL